MRQVIYFSTAAKRQDALVVAGIVAQSRVHNLRDRITGLLIAGGHRYLQVIEGKSTLVEQLIERLRRDDRHVGMVVLLDRPIEARSFGAWSMAFAKEPRLGEFATFEDLVREMRGHLDDSRLREKLSCFARTFSSAEDGLSSSLWRTAANDRGSSAVDCCH